MRQCRVIPTLVVLHQSNKTSSTGANHSRSTRASDRQPSSPVGTPHHLHRANQKPAVQVLAPRLRPLRPGNREFVRVGGEILRHGAGRRRTRSSRGRRSGRRRSGSRKSAGAYYADAGTTLYSGVAARSICHRSGKYEQVKPLTHSSSSSASSSSSRAESIRAWECYGT